MLERIGVKEGSKEMAGSPLMSCLLKPANDDVSFVFSLLREVRLHPCLPVY